MNGVVDRLVQIAMHVLRPGAPQDDSEIIWETQRLREHFQDALNGKDDEMLTKMSKKQRRRLKKQKRIDAKANRSADRRLARVPQPTKTVDQVFVSNGKKFHHCWCDAMNGTWLDGSNSIKVISRNEAIGRGLGKCQLCEKIVPIP